MSGPLWTTDAATVRRDTVPCLPVRRPRWAADPLDELTDRFRELIAAAVHPDEIAAILESDGMTDDHIRRTYGRGSSFTLAEDLFARVPRAHPEPDTPVPWSGDLWRTGLVGCLLRGLVFALPGLAYVLAAPFLAGEAADVLLAGALVGWAWNQALAHRAYTWLGLADRPSAARALLTGAPAGALLGTAVAVAVAGRGDGGAATFATAQALYQGAATALLVLGRERLLLYALTPMATGALVTLPYEVPALARAALLIASGAAILTLASREVLRAGPFFLPTPPLPGCDTQRLRRVASIAGRARFSAARAMSAPPAFEERGPGRRPSAGRGGVGKSSAAHASGGPGLSGIARPSLLRSVPYGVFGLAGGVLVLHAVLADALDGGTGAAVPAPGAVALTLSMGPAEWLLYRFRRGSDAGLRASTTSRAFRRSATVTLAQCLSAYLAVLLVLLAATTLLWLGAPVPNAARASALLLVGVMLWTGLLLQSFGAVTTAAAVCGAAALLQIAALFAGPALADASALAVPGVASAVLVTLVCVRLGRATAHRG